MAEYKRMLAMPHQNIPGNRQRAENDVLFKKNTDNIKE